MQGGLTSLSKELADFRASYPDRTFYRASEFRSDFVAYAGEAACTVEALQAAKVPANAPPVTKEFDSTVKSILVDYAAALEKGRDAVSQRNTSKYRDWWDSMDALEARATAAVSALGQN
jgi:hypothetical protein